MPRLLLDTARTQGRTLIPVGITVVVGLVLIALLLGGYAKLLGAFAYEQVIAALATFETMSVAVILMALPLLLLSVVALATWAGVVTLAASAALDRRPASMPSAALRALARSPRVIGAVALLVLAVLGAVVATPVLVVVGILGLLLRWTRPERATLIAMAIPFGFAVLLLVRWSLVVPALLLDAKKVRPAFAASTEHVRGRAVPVAVVLLVTALLGFGASEGAAALVAAVGAGAEIDVVARLVALLLVGALPVVAAVVLYRAGEGRRAAALPKPATKLTRVAAVTIAALVLPLTVGIAPLAAYAAPGTTPVAVTINTDPASPFTANTSTGILVTVQNAVTAEGVQPTGNLTIRVDGSVVPGTHAVSNANQYRVDHVFGPGSHTIEVDYPGDATFEARTGSLVVSAGTTTTTSLSSSAASVVYGATVDLTATVTGGIPTGDVTFEYRPVGGGVMSPLDDATLTGAGTAVLDDFVVLLAPGSYELGAHYLGAGGHLESWSDPVPFEVTAAATTTTLTVPPTSALGDTVTAAVTVENVSTDAVPAGSAAIYVDGSGTAHDIQPLVGGEADLTLSLPQGPHTLRVEFQPGTGFVTSDTTGSHTVTGPTPTLVLDVDRVTSVSGQVIALTATFGTTTPTGLVRFEARPATGPAIDLGDSGITDGVATLNAATIPVGTYDLVAIYEGDSATGPATSNTRAVTVSKADAHVSVVASGASPVVGGTMSLEITVTAVAPGGGTPSGTLTVTWAGGRRDLTVDAGGVAETHGIPLPSGGPLTFTATYSGDLRFEDAVGTEDVVVGGRATKVLLGGAINQSYRYGDEQVHFGSVHPLTGSSVPTGDVELLVGGAVRATTTLVNGGYTFTVDDIPVGLTLDRPLTVRYLGDVDHAPSNSDATAAGIISLELDEAEEDFDVQASPGVFSIGDTVQVQAKLPMLGVGPTGTVTFSIGGSPVGTSSFVNGVATLTHTVAQASTVFTVHYPGDGNFAETTAVYDLKAGRATATVELGDLPTGLRYGDVFTLTADVTIGAGGVPPTAPVTFAVEPFTVIGTATPNASGVASLQVCAGTAELCPSGVARIRMTPGTIVARYPDNSASVAAESAPAVYAPDGALTTTTLTSPSSVLVGSGMNLSATVAPVTAEGYPAGTVAFYGVDAGAETFLAMGTLDDGVATATPVVGDGVTDLRWPATAIIARYTPLGDAYEGSASAAKPVTITRIGVTVGIQDIVTPIVVGDDVTITVELTQAGGASADFRGDVTVTADDGDSCTAVADPGTRFASCDIEFGSSGTHRVDASFEGDVIYAPGDLVSKNFTVGVGTPVLGAHVSGSVIVDTDVAVTWNHFDLAATGTVEVYADGTKQCEVPIANEGCTIRFGSASATGSPVPVIVRYLGDGTFAGVQDDLTTTVTGCASLDVRSLQPSLGTVTVVTASNCGVGGYLVGTAVTVTATPGPDAQFLYWQRNGGTGYVVSSGSLTTTFTPTSDFETWLHVASFRATCVALGADVTGSGGIVVFPASNCTTPAHEPGYLPGTALTIYPDARYNGRYDEVDAFYAWGSGLTPDAQQKRDSSNRPYLALTISTDTVIPVTFGPRCRPVVVTIDPAGVGDRTDLVTPLNCSSPQGNGYLRFTSVTVTATPGTDRVLFGWAPEGVRDPALGRENQATITVGQAAITRITAIAVECFTLELVVDGGTDIRGREIGQLNADLAPNCPDGSPRYVGNTTVHVTPEVLVDGVTFTGWEDGDGLDRVNTPPVGPVTKAMRTVTVTSNLRLVGGFYLEDSCSRLSILGDLDAVTIGSDVGATGCGPGHYFDFQKVQGLRLDEPQWMQWQSSDRTRLVATVNPAEKLDVYISVRGDSRYCFGASSTPGPNENRGDWLATGPLTRPTDDCYVGGDIAMRVQACQTVTTDARFTLADGRVVGANTLPTVLLLPDANGVIGAYSMEGFDWSTSYGLDISSSGAMRVEEQRPGPCKDVGNAFPADTNIAAYAVGPSTGFVFQGWERPGAVAKVNPLITVTTGDARTLPLTASYRVTCHTISFGLGIRVDGNAPYCPGSDPADNSFIAGTAIQVTAAQHVESRTLLGFTSGVSGNQIYENPDTKELTGFVFVDGPKSVTADYPTEAQSWERGVAQGLKITVGFFAIAAPIFVGLLCPPIGMLFAFVAFGAGIANMWGDDETAAGFELMNPVGITNCAARWAFSNPGSATGNYGIGGTASTLNTIRKIAMDADVFTAPVGFLGAGGAIASFATGLYDAGIAQTDFSPQTIEQLRGTSTMTNCLDRQWRAVGADVG